jgi:hypothetical protein
VVRTGGGLISAFKDELRLRTHDPRCDDAERQLWRVSAYAGTDSSAGPPTSVDLLIEFDYDDIMAPFLCERGDSNSHVLADTRT